MKLNTNENEILALFIEDTDLLKLWIKKFGTVLYTSTDTFMEFYCFLFTIPDSWEIKENLLKYIDSTTDDLVTVADIFYFCRWFNNFTYSYHNFQKIHKAIWFRDWMTKESAAAEMQSTTSHGTFWIRFVSQDPENFALDVMWSNVYKKSQIITKSNGGIEYKTSSGYETYPSLIEFLKFMQNKKTLLNPKIEVSQENIVIPEYEYKFLEDDKKVAEQQELRLAREEIERKEREIKEREAYAKLRAEQERSEFERKERAATEAIRKIENERKYKEELAREELERKEKRDRIIEEEERKREIERKKRN